MRCKTEQEGSGRLPNTPRKQRHPPGIGRSPQGPRHAARRGVRQMTVQAVGASRPLDRIRLTAINPSGALRKHGAPPAFFINRTILPNPTASLQLVVECQLSGDGDRSCRRRSSRCPAPQKTLFPFFGPPSRRWTAHRKCLASSGSARVRHNRRR